MSIRLHLTFAAFFAAASTALAQYIPDQDIKVERTGLTTFRITGTNTDGKVDVSVEDKHMFRGFKAEGTNGEKKVELDVRSAGLGAGWKIEGKIGDDRVEGQARKRGTFSKEWDVEAKIGSRKVVAKVHEDSDIDPAVAAIFVLFDCCKDEESPEEDDKKEKAPEKGSGESPSEG